MNPACNAGPAEEKGETTGAKGLEKMSGDEFQNPHLKIGLSNQRVNSSIVSEDKVDR